MYYLDQWTGLDWTKLRWRGVMNSFVSSDILCSDCHMNVYQASLLLQEEGYAWYSIVTYLFSSVNMV